MDQKLLKEYISGIDGLRAIAVLAVILFHMNLIPFWQGGFTGVDVFFVISGYVISKTLARNSEMKLGRYILGFYKRRLTRIMPALLVMLLVTVIAATLFIPSSWLSNTIDNTGLSAFFGYSNFSLAWNNDSYFSPKVELNPFLHTWSLAVEEQFYLIFPLIFFFILKINSKRKEENNNKIFYYLPFIILIIFAGSSFIFSIFESTRNFKNAFYLLPSRFWELAAGAILFELHNNNRFIPKRKSLLNIFIASGFCIVMVGFFTAKQDAFPFPWALLPVLGTLLMICGVQENTSPSILQKFLSSPAMTSIGKISYSLYLWHWPISALFRWTFGFENLFSKGLYVLLTFFLAIISYYFIENPVRKSLFIMNQKNWKVVASALTVIVLCFLSARFITDAKSLLSLSVTKNKYIWQSGWFYKNDGPDNPITEDTNILGRQIFAVGDSHTAAYRTMLHIVSKELGLKIYKYEQGDCPVAGLLRPMNEETQIHFKNSLDAIKKLAKPGDVIFLASFRMPEFADHFEPVKIDKIAEDFLSEKAVKNRKQALAETDNVIKDFTDLGAIVVMEAPLPVLLSPPYRCSDWFNNMNPIGANGLTVNRDFLEKMRQPVMESISSLKNKHKDFYVWDPFPILCKEDLFSAYDQSGNPIFWDGDHLSGQGNRILAPSFREFLISLWEKK